MFTNHENTAVEGNIWACLLDIIKTNDTFTVFSSGGKQKTTLKQLIDVQKVGVIHLLAFKQNDDSVVMDSILQKVPSVVILKLYFTTVSHFRPRFSMTTTRRSIPG